MVHLSKHEKSLQDNLDIYQLGNSTVRGLLSSKRARIDLARQTLSYEQLAIDLLGRNSGILADPVYHARV